MDESLEELLCWFGPPGEHGVETLRGQGLLGRGNRELRQAYLDRVGPLLEEVGVRLPPERLEDPRLPWERWNHLQRRLDPAPATT
jgi:1,2-phenylacetyl-CoA epoxidase catalytic subunit